MGDLSIWYVSCLSSGPTARAGTKERRQEKGTHRPGPHFEEEKGNSLWALRWFLLSHLSFVLHFVHHLRSSRARAEGKEKKILKMMN